MPDALWTITFAVGFIAVAACILLVLCCVAKELVSILWRKRQ